jgi:hypothetical protein
MATKMYAALRSNVKGSWYNNKMLTHHMSSAFSLLTSMPAIGLGTAAAVAAAIAVCVSGALLVAAAPAVFGRALLLPVPKLLAILLLFISLADRAFSGE